MKVVHINEHLARKGGVETYLLALMPLLEDRGIEQVVAFGEGDPSEHPASKQIPEIRSASFFAQGSVRSEVAAFLRSERPDVVHIHNFRNVGAVEASLDYGPTIMTSHDYRSVCPASTLFYKRGRSVCDRTCGPGCFTTTVSKHCLTPRPKYASYYYYRSSFSIDNASRFASVIAPSGGARQRLVQGGFDAEKVKVLPYFCPVEPAVEPRAIPTMTRITYIGRIAPNKGHEFFVRALGLLPDSIEGVMVGNISESDERELTGIASESGCNGRLRFRRWASRAEVLQILDETTVLVFPSLWPETLGIVGLEALARGVPVVASDLGGVREWLRHDENGMLVAPKAPEQIRDAVLHLVASEEKLSRAGECGIETVRSRFMPEQHVRALVDIYQQAAGTSS